MHAHALILVLLFGGSSVAYAAAPQDSRIAVAEPCLEVSLRLEVSLPQAAQPQWAATGTWLAPNELLLIDALSKEFLRYDNQGKFLGKESESLTLGVKKAYNGFLPIAAHGTEEDLWLQLVGTKMARVEWGEVTDTKDLWGLPVRHDAKLIGIHNWSVSDGELFGYGLFEMQDDAKTVKGGFFRLNLFAPADVTLIRELSREHPVHLWYRLGHQYLATLNGVNYGLWIDEKNNMSLVKYNPDTGSLEDLQVLPPELATPPELPAFVSTEDFDDVMAAVEDATMITGLYAWRDALYIVWRTQDSKNHQEWFLSRIDPVKEILVKTVMLPTAANHLLVIPDSSQWALLEKGPVRGFGFQSLGKLKLISVEGAESLTKRNHFCGKGRR